MLSILLITVAYGLILENAWSKASAPVDRIIIAVSLALAATALGVADVR